MSPLPEQKFNNDLLLTEDDRKLAAERFPELLHVLDFRLPRGELRLQLRLGLFSFRRGHNGVPNVDDSDFCRRRRSGAGSASRCSS